MERWAQVSADVPRCGAAAVPGAGTQAEVPRGQPQLGQLLQTAGGRPVHPLHGLLHDTGEKVWNVNVEPTLICLLSHLSYYFGPGLVLRHQRRSGAIIYHTLSFCFLILPSPSSLFIKVHITLIPRRFKTTIFVFAKIGFQILKLCHLYMLHSTSHNK